MDNLNATKDSFVDVSDGIAVSRQETSVIESNADLVMRQESRLMMS